ncbi:MAG: DNA recombination protein RmuC [Ignavibacterium sp.]|nr:DNA recombination protein RmuC [Ignavibacterium sp.]
MEFVIVIFFVIITIILSILLFKNLKSKPTDIIDKLNEELNYLQIENGKLNERIKILEQDKQNLQTEINSERQRIEKLQSENASLKTENSFIQEKLNEQKSEIEELQQRFTKEFENLANKIFEEKSAKFTEQNKEKLSEILTPLREKIIDFERKVEESNKESIKGHSSLKEQLEMLRQMNQQITQEAKNLTEALKGQTKTQGSWGEFILESILEKSGLVKGREYFVQESFTDESGKRLQPDVIVNLPENKSIIIDSKVSLNAYERYISTDDETKKALALRDHLISIRSHLKNLSSKNYQSIYKLNSLDFVLMFMPIEPAFALAVQNDPSIFNEAFEMKIVIVSPSTLLATLRTIANIWRQENQNKNALEIARQAGSLYDKFVSFYNDLIEVGKKLDSAKDSYRDAMKKIHDGRGNLISGVEKIKELGAKASKSLPTEALNRADYQSE